MTKTGSKKSENTLFNANSMSAVPITEDRIPNTDNFPGSNPGGASFF